MASIQVIGPKETSASISSVIQKYFPELQSECIEYKQFTQATQIVQALKPPADIILFSGIMPYLYAKDVLPQRSICTYLYIGRDYIVKSLFLAQRSGILLSRLSIDTFSETDVVDTLIELNIDPQTIKLFNIPFKESNLLNEVEPITARHIHNYSVNKATCCLTTFYTVYTKLKNMDIPCIYMTPPSARIEDTIRLALLESANIDELGSNVVICAKIDDYDEHSFYYGNKGQQALNRGKIINRLYQFSEQLNGALIEGSADSFWIFVNNTKLRHITDNFRDMRIQNEISENFPHTLSIGIGYGSNIMQAKQFAEKALTKALADGPNKTYLVKDNIISQISKPLPKHSEVNGTLVDIADKVGISINILFKLIGIARMYGLRKTFTAAELSILSKVNIRTINRALDKLEAHNYCEFIGKKNQRGAGRPSRLIKFKLRNLT